MAVNLIVFRHQCGFGDSKFAELSGGTLLHFSQPIKLKPYWSNPSCAMLPLWRLLRIRVICCHIDGQMPLGIDQLEFDRENLQ